MTNLFSGFSRRQRGDSTSALASSLTASGGTSSANYETEEAFAFFRLVVFLESDSRKLLYDSKSVSAAERQSNATSAATTDSRARKPPSQPVPFILENLRVQSDTKQLCEMIFGSMNMVYHGCSMKVHHNIAPASGDAMSYGQQTMISYLSQFSIDASRRLRNPPDKNPSMTRAASTTAASLPSRRSTVLSTVGDAAIESLFGREGDWLSRWTENATPPPSSLESSPRLHPNSLSNLYLRRHTTLRDGFSSSSFRAMSSAASVASSRTNSISQVSSVSKQLWQTSIPSFYAVSNDMTDLSTMMNNTLGASRERRVKIGIAMLFPSNCHDIRKQGQTLGAGNTVGQFIQSHVTLLEGYLENMKRVVENALLDKATFLTTVHARFILLRKRFLRLLRDNRTVPSIWLSLHFSIKDPVFIRSIGKSSCNYFHVLSQLSSKEFLFFAQLLTLVLSHHTAWITSECVDTVEKRQSSRVDCKWIQLCDTFGLTSSPTRALKIVVSGKNQKSVDKLLLLLSYFIRPKALSRRYAAAPSLTNSLSSMQQNLSSVEFCPVEQLPDFDPLDAVLLGGFETVCPVSPAGKSLHDGLVEDTLHSQTDGFSLTRTPGSSDVRESFQCSLATEAGSGSSASTVKQENVKHVPLPTVASAGELINYQTEMDRNQSLRQSVSPNFSDFKVKVKEHATISSMSTDRIDGNQNSAVEMWIQRTDEECSFEMRAENDSMIESANYFDTDSTLFQNNRSETLNGDVEISEVPLIGAALLSTGSELCESSTTEADATSEHMESGSISPTGHPADLTDVRDSYQLCDNNCVSIEPVNIDENCVSNSLKRYINMTLAEDESVCAPTSVHCTSVSSSIAHSLIGIMSDSYSEDAQLQGCLTPGTGTASLYETLIDESHKRFIVDSSPVIILAESDKLQISIFQHGVHSKIPRSQPASQSLQSTLQKACALHKLSLASHCCFNIVDLGLRALVEKSVALSSLLLSPQESQILDRVPISPSDLTLLRAIAHCVQFINNQE